MTHAEACHAAFDRAGLWHWVGEGRRLEHYMRTGRWQPPETAWVYSLSEESRQARAEWMNRDLYPPAMPWESYG
jgi:hypothetical protein